jgi:hypothetical protein
MRSASLACVIAVLVFLSPDHVVGGTAAAAARPRAGDTNAPLDLALTYAYGTEPATLHAVVTVERHADNRILRVVADSDRWYSSSDIQLEGTESPRHHSVRWTDLPAGDYCIQVTLVRSTGALPSVRRPFWVLGPSAPTPTELSSPCAPVAATVTWPPGQSPLDEIVVPSILRYP